MKQTKIIAFLALAFMLGIAAPVVGIAAQNQAVAVEQSTTTEVGTEGELRSAITQGAASITLTADINLTSRLTINRAEALVINLNGHKITANSKVKNVILISRGNVRVSGTGSIETQRTTFTLEGSDQPSATDYSVLTIDKGVTIKSVAWYGIAADVYQANSGGNGKASYGVRVNLNGTIVAPYGISIHGSVQNSTNAPIINIGDGAVINASDNSADDATPIYSAGVGTWNVGAANLTGHVAVGAKAGKMTFTNTSISIDGNMTSAPKPSTGGINGYSSVFQIEHHSAYADAVEINVNGGKYTSENGDVFYEYNLVADTQIAADIDIAGGTFTAAAGKPVFGGDVAEMDIEISGGTFSGSDVAQFKENGYLVDGFNINEDGVVIAPAKPSTGKHSNTASMSSLSTADGAVTISGNLGKATTIKADPVEKKLAGFGKYKTAVYDLRLLDANGEAVTLAEPVTVSIEVPTTLDGTKSRIYYINNDDAAEQLESYYVDGRINFSTTHLSLYAIVENSGSILAAGNSGQQVPNTGAISKQGIITAIATTVPLMVLAGVAFIWFNRHMIKVRRAERLAEAERERIMKAYIPKAKKEASIDHFVATPIAQHNPDGPMVDMFIK